MNSADQNPYNAPQTAESPGDASSHLRALLSVAAILSATAIVFLVLFMGPFAWLLRDGLGPDSTTSSGWSAIVRMFWCFYWGPITLASLLAFGASAFCLYQLSRSVR